VSRQSTNVVRRGAVGPGQRRHVGREEIVWPDSDGRTPPYSREMRSTRPPPHHAMDRRDRTLLYDAARKALCLELSLGGTPGEGILMRPSGPCSLNRITQSRSV